MRERGEAATAVLVSIGIVAAFGLLIGGCFAVPAWRVYMKSKEGEAELAQAESNRKIAVLEAQAKMEAAAKLAQAEIERAKGVAEANRIIGEGLRGHEEYLRYLWIMSLEHVAASVNGSTVVYVPTEANLPLMEAGRGVPK